MPTMILGASYSTLCPDELLSRLVPRYAVERPLECLFWQRGVNDTYRVRCANRLCSLRVYRYGLRSFDEIAFEVDAL